MSGSRFLTFSFQLAEYDRLMRARMEDAWKKVQNNEPADLNLSPNIDDGSLGDDEDFEGEYYLFFFPLFFFCLFSFSCDSLSS